MKYIIYKHTLNGKEYIGYSKLTLGKRLEKHIKEANTGSQRHFCRAIRKYGADKITSVILCTTFSQKEAKKLERKYIAEYKTFYNGYNMTEGGDGGNTTRKLSNTQKAQLKKTRSANATGISNPNASGKTREQILELALQVLKDNNMNWNRNDYMKRATVAGYPVNIYCSGMFNKSWKEDLIEYIREQGYNILEIKYRPTKEHIANNAGCRQKGGKWFYNEKIKKSKFFNPGELINVNNDWKPGRKLSWD